MSSMKWRKVSGGTEVLARDLFGNPSRTIIHPSVYEAVGASGTVYRIRKGSMGWLNDWGNRVGSQWSSTLQGAKNNAEAWESMAA